MIYDYWHLYKERVDPVTKILHIPSFEKILFDAMNNLYSISAGLEALMFSIYYAAVYSMSVTEFQDCECKEKLLEKLGHACKLALSNANLLCSQDMVALQALTIFLVSCYCFNPTSPSLYTIQLLILSTRSATIKTIFS